MSDARCFELYHPDNIEAARKAFRPFPASGKVDNAKLQLRRKDRIKVYVMLNATAVYDGSGKIAYSRSSLRDITELKKTEEELRRQRDLLQQLIDTIPAPIFYKDASGRYLGCNRAFESDTGMHRADIVGRTAFDVYPPDLAEIYHEQDLSLLRSPGVQQGETQRRDAEGNMHEVMFTKSTFSDSEGNVAGLVGVIVDITQRKRAEDDLRESEKKFRLVTETIQDVFWLASPDIREMMYVSPGYEWIWGRSTESLYESPKSFLEAIIPEDRDRVMSVLQASHSGVKEYTCEYRIVRPDGSLRWIFERGFPVYDNRGKHTHMCGVCSDITERKQAEEALQASEERYQNRC